MWAGSRVCKPPELESKGHSNEGSGSSQPRLWLHSRRWSALCLLAVSSGFALTGVAWGGANGPMGGDGHRSAIAPSWLWRRIRWSWLILLHPLYNFNNALTTGGPHFVGEGRMIWGKKQKTMPRDVGYTEEEKEYANQFTLGDLRLTADQWFFGDVHKRYMEVS